MSGEYIRYRAGYKYQLAEAFPVNISITPDNDIRTDFIELDTSGHLPIKKGYAWDGPSGPTIDTPNIMRGSLVHDALYQLLRHELLDELWRPEIDAELKQMCLDDGMLPPRAWWVYKAVRKRGKMSASPKSKKEVRQVP